MKMVSSDNPSQLEKGLESPPSPKSCKCLSHEGTVTTDTGTTLVGSDSSKSRGEPETVTTDHTKINED